jgi:small subunit ribosomal protein S3Ae
MAVGKNKRLTKGKKGGKKKTVDPFTKKEWYDIKTPAMFSVRTAGKTLVSKSQGLKLSTDGLKGRVLEANLADLNNDDDQGYRKVQLEIQEVQGRNCLADFHGMSLTRDKQMQLVRKWNSLIEAHCKVKTTDGYVLRMFCIAFTKRQPDQVRQTNYAGASQIRRIRKKMVEVMQKEASKSMLRDLVKKLIPEALGKEIEKATRAIFPIQNCLMRKVKMVKKPKFDLTKLMELHTESLKDDVGTEMLRPETEEAQNTLTAEVKAED